MGKRPTGLRLSRMRQYRRNYQRMAPETLSREAVVNEIKRRARIGVAKASALLSTGTLLGLALGMAVARWFRPEWWR